MDEGQMIQFRCDLGITFTQAATKLTGGLLRAGFYSLFSSPGLEGFIAIKDEFLGRPILVLTRCERVLILAEWPRCAWLYLSFRARKSQFEPPKISKKLNECRPKLPQHLEK